MAYYSIKNALKLCFFSHFSRYKIFRENIKIYCKNKKFIYNLLCLRK